MKLFLILIFVGYASATLFEALERESRATVNAFVNGIQGVTPLHIALGIEDSEELQRVERGIKEDLEEHIKDAFGKALKKIEDAVINGHKVNEEALKQLRDLHNELKNLNIEDNEIKFELDVLKKMVDAQLKFILDKMGIFDKRRSVEPEPELFESVLGDLSVREMFLKLRNMILEKMNLGAVKHSLAKIVGQGAQKLCEWLTNKGKEKVMNFFDRVLESDEETEETKKRAAEDRFETVKDYLENIETDAENKLVRFKEWLDDVFRKGFEDAKEGLTKMRDLIKVVTSKGKNVSKKGLAEILDFIRQNEDKFGFFKDIKNAIKEALNKID